MVGVVSSTPTTKILSTVTTANSSTSFFIWQTFTLDGRNPQRHLSLPLGIWVISIIVLSIVCQSSGV